MRPRLRAAPGRQAQRRSSTPCCARWPAGRRSPRCRPDRRRAGSRGTRSGAGAGVPQHHPIPPALARGALARPLRVRGSRPLDILQQHSGARNPAREHHQDIGPGTDRAARSARLWTSSPAAGHPVRSWCGAAIRWRPTSPAAGSSWFRTKPRSSWPSWSPRNPGQRVLDACAAPGGKTVAIAGGMADRGLLLAADLRPARTALLARTLAACGCRMRAGRAA